MTPEELFKKMHQIKYGFFVDPNEVITVDDPRIDDHYLFWTKGRVLTPPEVWKYKVGTCWDQTLLEFYELGKMSGVSNLHGFYYAHIYNHREEQTHTGVTYKYQGKFWYFEHAWHDHKKIHGPYNSQHEVDKKVIELGKSNFSEKGHDFWIDNRINFKPILNNKHLSIKKFIEFCHKKCNVKDLVLY